MTVNTVCKNVIQGHGLKVLSMTVNTVCMYVCMASRRNEYILYSQCNKFSWNPYSSFDNMKVWIFRKFSTKMPIHTPRIGVLEGFDLNGKACQWNLNSHILVEKRHHMMYRLSKSVHRHDLCAWLRNQKERQRNLPLINWVFVQIIHVIGLKWFGTVGVRQ